MSMHPSAVVVTCGNPQCLEDITQHDIEIYDGVCPACWTALSSSGFIEKDSFHDSDKYLYYTDVPEITGTFSLLFENFTTLCCSNEAEYCECEFPERAPTFEDALDKYSGLLPVEMYEPSFTTGCNTCVHQWNGGCEPLRTTLYIVHQHEAEKAVGVVGEEFPYIGEIDGCINYTTQTVGENYVREVIIRAER